MSSICSLKLGPLATCLALGLLQTAPARASETWYRWFDVRGAATLSVTRRGR
jgi:hypothetical protein